MVARAKDGIVKRKLFADLSTLGSTKLIYSLFSSTFPKSFKPASKNPLSLIAIEEEMEGSHANNTWESVPRPTHSNVVGSKWIFRTKFHSDGTIERYKARLVARFYSST